MENIMFESTVANLSDQINSFLNNAIPKLVQDLDFVKIEIELRKLLKEAGEKLLQLILASVLEHRFFIETKIIRWTNILSV